MTLAWVISKILSTRIKGIPTIITSVLYASNWKYNGKITHHIDKTNNINALSSF